MKKTLKLTTLSCALALTAIAPGYGQNSTQIQSGDNPSDANQPYHQNQANTQTSDQNRQNTFRDSQSRYGRDTSTSQLRNEAPAAINKAHSLIGMRVRNQQNERLGKIKDVVLDLQSGRVAYVVLSTGGFRPKYVALPPSAFSAAASDKYLTLNADKDKVMNAAGFTRNNWPNMASPSWGAEPFWQSPDSSSYEKRDNDASRSLDSTTPVVPSPNPNPSPSPTTPD